jgi:hypothetical protein
MIDTDVAMHKALELVGVTPTDQAIEQFRVLVRCMELYEERDQKYGSAWKRLGALNNLTRMSTKIERLLAMYWHKRPPRMVNPDASWDLDDAFDLINYSAFFIRQAQTNEWTQERS